MFVPTHIQVLVQRARGLRTKGKNGTNNCFVIIALGKEKFQTSVLDKCEYPEWNEEAELSIPTQGNTATIILTVYHQNLMGLKDEFLGETHLPLSQFEFDHPKSRWYKLYGRGGKEDGKPRGDLEVQVSFSSQPLTASLTELHKKKSHSLKHLSSMAQSMGGSLMSLGKEKKSLKKLASSVGHKMSDKLNIKKHKRKSSDSSSIHDSKGQEPGEADPGVISEEESDYEVPMTPTSLTSSSTVPMGHSLEGSFEGLNLAPLPIKPGFSPSKFTSKNTNYFPEDDSVIKTTFPTPRNTKVMLLSSNSDKKKHGDSEGIKNNDMHDDLCNTPSLPTTGSKVHDLVTGTKSDLCNYDIQSNQNPLIQRQIKDFNIPSIPTTPNTNTSFEIKNTPLQPNKSMGRVIISIDPPPSDNILSNKEESLLTNTIKTSSSPLEIPMKTDNHIPTKDESLKFKSNAIKGFIKNNFKFIHNNNKDSLVLSSLTCNEKASGKESLDAARNKFLSYSREELIEKIAQLEASVSIRDQQIEDLESYIDNLLVRVMESSPKLLQCFHLE